VNSVISFQSASPAVAFPRPVWPSRQQDPHRPRARIGATPTRIGAASDRHISALRVAALESADASDPLRAESTDLRPDRLAARRPNRATWIAERFDGGAGAARQVNSHRGMFGYTGTYHGVPVSVQTSGMARRALPSWSRELLRLGAGA